MSFFSRVFRSKDSSKKHAKQNGAENAATKEPQWTDPWTRIEVGPEEVVELLGGCTQELKSRALDIPFLLLPFRPSSDPSASRTFVRHYFGSSPDKKPLRGEQLKQELRLTEPMVLCSVMKWCWSRLPGGIVTWEAYELFKIGEQDANLARDAFSTFIPLSVESDARTKIIFYFFDLLAAIAAHGKSNGLGGRKLSRYAGWWAFEHTDTGNGFEAGYKNWANAADATSHLFFAYLRSLSPDSLHGANGISALPISLQSLVQATEYPPEPPSLLQISSTKVIMIVDTVSPTPFALLRRAKNFQYRDSDYALQEFSNYEDPVRALTDECRRVLKSISSANQVEVSTSKASTSLRDASWSRFEDIGFGGTIDELDADETAEANGQAKNNAPTGLRSAPHSRSPDLGRPTTPSWADFMSSGFTDENGVRNPAPLLLPPDKVLPPISTVRGQSSQSHRRLGESESTLEPGELASITALDLDDSFWWVWLTSLAGEEPTLRKGAFGRCALIETVIPNGRWLVMEEQIKGAAPEPEAGAYIAEKKSFFGFTTRGGKLTRRKSSTKKIKTLEEPYKKGNNPAPSSKTSFGPDQHARIQAAAAALQRKHKEQEREEELGRNGPRADDTFSNKTNSVLTLQPTIVNEASPAMKWASNYDKHAVRAAYLSNSLAGTGTPTDKIIPTTNGHAQGASGERDLPVTPQGEPHVNRDRRVSPAAPLPSTHGAHNTETEKKTAADAATVPLPENTPVKHAEKSKLATAEITDESEPKQSIDEDGGSKKLKKKAGTSGLKGIFGKKKVEQPPMKPTGAEIPSVAAARVALEGRTAQVAQETPSALKTSGSNRLSGFRRKPVGDSSAAESTSSKPSTPPKAEMPKQAAAPAPAPIPVPTQAPISPPVSPPVQYDGPPRTHRDDDELSRVNTAERADADREFSSFDQGPLVEQPAFVPDDTPTAESFSETAPPPYQHPASRQTENGNDTNGSSLSDEPIPVHDRWAQIRKNAAERATQPTGEEPQGRASQAEKTDDGETSGEETIESRVARIKARVAELTGNMES